MKAGVITFPNSNNYDDHRFTLEEVNGWDVDLLWHKDKKNLKSYNLIVLPGGFSYGDYLRAGAMGALSPMMECVKEFAAEGGLVLGTCNGFQTLCEAHLLPGALARNAHLKFSSKDVLLKVTHTDSPWTCAMKENAQVCFPIAHGQGRYVIAEEEYLKLKENGQILLEYVDNPNGSLHDIAGVCNKEKNVFGLMPHPERSTDLKSLDGKQLWQSVERFLNER